MTGDNLRLVSKEDVVTARDSLAYWEGQRKAIARGNAEAIHEDKQIRADVLTANFQENEQGELEVHRIDAAGNVEHQTAKEYESGAQSTHIVDKEHPPPEGEL